MRTDVTRTKEACWPTPRQELLLKAALLDGDAARSAWEAWSTVPLQKEYDPDSIRLFPLLRHNLRANGIDVDLPVLAGKCRETWCRNQILLNGLRDILARFTRAGIPTLVLKGIALTTFYYPNHALRPMGDLDVLVPIEDAERAARLLEALGCVTGSRPGLDHLPHRHAHAYYHPDGTTIVDLHWHILKDSRNTAANRDFWQAAEPVAVQGQPTRRLHPSDQLLHVVAHSLCYRSNPPAFWIADAKVILDRLGPALDQNRLLYVARRHALGLTCFRAFDYVNGLFPSPVLDELVARLGRGPFTREERDVFRFRARPASHVRQLWLYHRRAAPERGWLGSAVRFPGALQVRFNLERPWHLARVLGPALANRARRIAGRPSSGSSDLKDSL